MSAEPVHLQLRRFTGPHAGPHLLITGGVHGDEFEPMIAIRRLIRSFQDEPRLLDELRGSVTLVPVVNEAAFLRGHRTAEDGLDLARTCPGRADGSITERTAHALSGLIRAASHYLDLHTGGTDLAVQPLAGYVLHADATVLETQRRMARAFNLPVVWGTSAALQGRSLSVARDAGVPAIYAEYLGSAVCHPEGTEAYVEGCWNVMAELGMLTRPRPPGRVRHVIEDIRPQSGHMQICHPAPITGCFEAAVKLGQLVKRGEPLGTISDVLGDTVHPVCAEEDGLVLVLRTFPRVRRGESLGVVAPLDA